jgi:phosphatidylglycerophosphate synthase
VTPDTCTVVGVLGAVLTAVSYILSNLNPGFLWLASLGFVINWIGDSMDGTLARHRKIERPVFGFFVDHMTDAVSQVIIFLGLGLTPYIRFDLACLGLITYLLLSVLVFVRTCSIGEFKISYGKIGPTEIRAIAIIINTIMFFGGKREMVLTAGALGRLTYSPYDFIVVGITLLLLYFFVINVVQETIRLVKSGR